MMLSAERRIDPLILLKVLTVVGVCLHIITLVWTPVDGHDADCHLVWIKDYQLLFGHTSWYPRWSTQTMGGFGAPIFYWYPPLSYIVGAVLSNILAISDTVVIVKLIAAVGYVGSILSALFFFRSVGYARSLALLASLCYAFNPYRYHTLFTRSALSEHMSYVFLPLILWGVWRLWKGVDSRAFVLLGVSCAALLLTNIPVALIVYILAFAAVIRVVQNDRSSALTLFSALIPGFGIAAILLLPAWSFKDRLNTAGLIHIGEHSPMMEILDSGYLLNRTLLPLIFLASVAIWWRTVKSRKHNSDTFLISLPIITLWSVALVFQLPFAMAVVSKVFPFLGFIQFPWRMDVLLTFLLVVGLFDRLKSNESAAEGMMWRVSLVCIALACSLTILVTAGNIFQFRAGKHAVDLTGIRPEYISPNMHCNLDSLHNEVLHSSTAFQFLGRRATVRGIDASDPYNVRYELNVPNTDTLRLQRYYWPEWQATSASVLKSWPDSCGRTLIEVPQGTSTLRYRLLRSQAEVAGGVISLFSLAALGVGWIFLRSRERRTSRKQRSEQ